MTILVLTDYLYHYHMLIYHIKILGADIFDRVHMLTIMLGYWYGTSCNSLQFTNILIANSHKQYRRDDMNRKHMKGFIDPITLGFILSIVGSATVLTFDKPASSDQVAKQDSIDKVELVAQQPAVKGE